MAASTVPSATRGILGKKAGSKNSGKSAQAERPAQPPIGSSKNVRKQLLCPECGCPRIWKDGLRYVKTETAELPIQRYLCRNCGRRFSESLELHVKGNIKGQQIKTFKSTPDLLNSRVLRTDFSVKKGFNDLALPVGEDVGSHDGSQLTNLGNLKYFSSYNSKRRVCDERNGSRKEHGSPVQMKHIGSGRAGVPQTTGMKNLAGVESRLEKAAGATKLSNAEIRGKIIEYSWFMKQEGYRPATISSYTDRIKTLVNKGVNLWDAEAVKKVIAGVPTWNDGSKKCFSDAYDIFARMEGLTWNKPRYKPRSKLPFIPTGKELDQLIHGCGKKMRAFLLGLKETGADPGELFAIEWIDIDFNRRKLAINHPVKYHNPRILNVSDEWLRMVSRLPRTSERVWGDIKYESNYNNLNAQRKRLAREYDNPRLRRITFTTFRHWKGTMLYHQTHDCMQVKEQLGHKSLISTQIYIHLEEKLFQQLNNEFIVRRAVSIKGMMALAAVGFEKFDQVGDVHLYRKPKGSEEL